MIEKYGTVKIAIEELHPETREMLLLDLVDMVSEKTDYCVVSASIKTCFIEVDYVLDTSGDDDNETE